MLGSHEETLDIDAASVKEGGSQTKAGFTVAVKSMSWTDDSTRVTVKARNESKDKATLSASDAALKQGSRQYDQSFEPRQSSSSSGTRTTSTFDPKPFRFKLTW